MAFVDLIEMGHYTVLTAGSRETLGRDSLHMSQVKHSSYCRSPWQPYPFSPYQHAALTRACNTTNMSVSCRNMLLCKLMISDVMH